MFLNPHLNGCIATTTTRQQMEAFLGAFGVLVRRAVGAAGL
jgi:hypothetical protein